MLDVLVSLNAMLGCRPSSAGAFDAPQARFSSLCRRRRHGLCGLGLRQGQRDDRHGSRAARPRLDEERRKLDEAQREFAEYVDAIRRAKDREEFERFMAERRARPAGGGSEAR